MKSRLFLLTAAWAVLASCSQEKAFTPEGEPHRAQLYGAELSPENIIPDRLNILFDEASCALLEAASDEDGQVQVQKVKMLDGSGITSLRRLFPYAGKFEKRTREAGLHRWYEAVCETVTRSADGLVVLPGVEIVEYNPKIEIVGNPTVVDVQMDDPAPRASSTTYPFNDPKLPSQWHYYNNGTAASSISGCDINVFPVWRVYTTGSPDVIVAVVDGGVDFKHEDLADNMWHNPEKSGDMQYGYNFVTNTFQVTPDDHGTHVAGTIAAVNNNGKGVCGIAGGNAEAGVKGVKIMSCQIFAGKQSGSGAAAIKWGADHGAVISQNSWGYTEETTTPASLKSAVDYFIANAGMDENGRQTGPLMGGIVIFAAGNESREQSSSDYGPIFSVAALGADYRKAYYSNWGDWVDIAAPGGDAKKGNFVLSTLPGNKYGTMQGTSMACPHVSGVAALIISRFGGMGYTPDNVARKMAANATSLAAYNRAFALGTGLVNAYRCIAGSGGKSPKTPSDLEGSTQSNNLHFSVKVPADEDDGKPSAIKVYYSPSNFTKISDDLPFALFYVEDLEPGETLQGTVTGLDFEKTYYVAAVAEDLAGNRSGLTPRMEVTTGINHAPDIVQLGVLSLTLKPHESGSMDFRVDEQDGHFYSLELDPGSETGVILDTLVRDMPKIRVNGPDVPSGSYQASLTVTDIYGLAAVRTVDFTILPNHAPYPVNQFQDVIFSSRTAGTQEIDCENYFKDDDGEDLSYDFSIDNETVVNMTAQGGTFFLTPMNYGYATITVTARDVRKETVEQSFRVLVRDGSAPLDIYPNPVRTNLYIRMGSEADISVRVITAAGGLWYQGEGHVTPFEPMVIDMSNAPSGAYRVLVSTGAEETPYNIVKL